MDVKDLRKVWDAFGESDPLSAILAEPEKRGGRSEPEDFFKTGEAQINERMLYVESLGTPLFQWTAMIPVTISLTGKPSHVRLVSATGKQWDLQGQYNRGRLQVNVPMRNGVDDCLQCGSVDAYLVVDR